MEHSKIQEAVLFPDSASLHLGYVAYPNPFQNTLLKAKGTLTDTKTVAEFDLLVY